MDRTGVDFRVFWPEDTLVYDFTVVNPRCRSHAASSPEAAVFSVRSKKHSMYDDQCASNGETLRVLVARVAGGLCGQTQAYIQRCADGQAARFPFTSAAEHAAEMVVQLSCALQRFNGEAVAVALAAIRSDVE